MYMSAEGDAAAMNMCVLKHRMNYHLALCWVAMAISGQIQLGDSASVSHLPCLQSTRPRSMPSFAVSGSS
jgi:hypothetical protein